MWNLSTKQARSLVHKLDRELNKKIDILDVFLMPFVESRLLDMWLPKVFSTIPCCCLRGAKKEVFTMGWQLGLSRWTHSDNLRLAVRLRLDGGSSNESSENDPIRDLPELRIDLREAPIDVKLAAIQYFGALLRRVQADHRAAATNRKETIKGPAILVREM